MFLELDKDFDFYVSNTLQSSYPPRQYIDDSVKHTMYALSTLQSFAGILQDCPKSEEQDLSKIIKSENCSDSQEVDNVGRDEGERYNVIIGVVLAPVQEA
jgi:hypothetical protein